MIGSRLGAHRLAYAALAALFVLSVMAVAGNVSASIDLIRNDRVYVRPPFYLGDANWGAVGLQPEAEAAGMKFGDAILAVHGRPIDGFFDYYGPLRQLQPGDRLQARVHSPGP